MGRHPLPSAIHTVDANDELIRADLDASAALPATLAAIQKNAQALAKELDYSGALTVESLEEEIKFYQRRSVEAVLETGKRLLLLKEVAGHGGFMERLDCLGIGQSLANKLMSATLKFSNSESTTILGLPNLNQGKLLELLALDDGEIEALNSGDQVRGIVLDDVDCMSVSELRRALRQEQADKEAEIDKVKAATSGQLAAKDKIIADKSKLISDLVTEKIRRDGLTDSELAAELERDLAEAMLLASGSTIPLRKAVDAIRGLDHVPQGLYVAMQGAIHRVLSEVESIADDYGISLDFGLPTAGKDDPLAGLDELDDPNAEEDFDAAP